MGLWWHGGTMKNGRSRRFSFTIHFCLDSRWLSLASTDTHLLWKLWGRRLLSCLVCMYFDDVNIVDWASAKGNSQMAFG